jgi:surfactin synthase thioesterase subunit
MCHCQKMPVEPNIPRHVTVSPGRTGTHKRPRRHAIGAFAAEATGRGDHPRRLIGCGMGEIVSFRRARKKAERRLAERTASANRLRYGRSKAERELEAKRDVKARRDLDRHRIETGDER